MNPHSDTTTQTASLRPDPATAAFLDALGVGALVASADGAIHYRNRLAARWLGSGNDMDAAFRGARFLGSFAGWASELSSVVEEGENLSFECALRRSDAGSPILVTVRCTPFRNADAGHTDGGVVFIEEGAQCAAAEQRLEVSRRLASLGKLAARVAHELNNPLDGILRYINLATRLTTNPDQEKLRGYLKESRTGLMRMAQIVGDLLEFTRSSDSEFEEAGINELLEQAVRSLSATAEANHVVVTVDFQTQDMPSAKGSRLYQVCCNLIKNAIDAMPDGGTLSITAGIVRDDVVIRVADTGVGLPDDVQKVFEPFFTTKHAGKGTGIGLAICKDYVSDMGGTIAACSGDEGGAVFTVRLPLASCRKISRLETQQEGAP